MKKIILMFIFVIFGANLGLAISSDQSVNVITTKDEQRIESNFINKKVNHELVNIYIKENISSQVSGKITLENRDNYNIFYCNNNGWCEVVNKNDGKTGWINLDQFKQAQKKYYNYMYTKNTLIKLVEYVNAQDHKISQLYIMMQHMQKQLSQILDNHSKQINQLNQAYYY